MRKILWIKSIEELTKLNSNLEESKKRLLEEIPKLKNEILNKNIESKTIDENISKAHNEYKNIQSKSSLILEDQEVLISNIRKKEEEIVFLHDKHVEITKNIEESNKNSFNLSLTNDNLLNDITILKNETDALSEGIFYKKLEITNYYKELWKVNNLINEEEEKLIKVQLKIKNIETREDAVSKKEGLLNKKEKRLRIKEDRLKDFKNELFLKRKLWQERETS